MSTKLYADNRCIAEFDSMNATQNGTYSPPQKDSYSSVIINTDQETKKKPCNCPNCGAPVSSYICEYCGTEFEKPKKKLSDEEMRDSINASLALQTCSLHDQMYNASILTNVYPTGRIEHIPISKDGNIEDTPVSEADEELITTLKWFMIGMLLFTLFAIGVTVIYNL